MKKKIFSKDVSLNPNCKHKEIVLYYIKDFLHAITDDNECELDL